MAHLDLDEQEQLAQLKAWWATYGNALIMALILGSLAFSGWQGWRYWQDSQAANASNQFEVLSKATQGTDAKAVRDSAGELLEKYPRTSYASMGALSSAKYFFERNDLKAAKAQLQWVIDNTQSEEFRDIARLRMASVLLDEKAHDEALKLLQARHGAAFEAQYAALRGDVLVAKGQAADARSAYKFALEKAGQKDRAAQESIQMRLDALGG